MSVDLTHIASDVWLALTASSSVAKPAIGTLLQAASGPEALPGLSWRSLLRVLHFAGLALGLGGSLVVDVLLQRHLYRHSVTRNSVELLSTVSRLVTVGFALLCISGCGFLALYQSSASQLLSNPKLAAKIVIVAVMLLNGLLIHRFALARVAQSVGRPLLAHAPLHNVLPMLAMASISVSGWLSATLMGLVPELNFAAPARTYLVAAGCLVLVTFLVLCVRHVFQSGGQSPQQEPNHPLASAEPEVAAHPSAHAPASVGALLRRNMPWLFVLTLCINVTMFAAPLHMLLVYDRVLTSGSTETLVMLTVICIVWLLAMSLLTAARQWMLVGKSEDLDRAFAPALFHREARNASQSTEAPLADLGAARQLVTSPAASAVLDLPFAPLFFVGLFILHPYFGILCAAGAAVMVAIAVFGDLFAANVTKQAGVAQATARHIAGEANAISRSAQAMGMLDSLGAMWTSLHFASGAAQSQAAAHSALVSQLVKFFRMALQSATLALGAWLVLHKECSSGAIIASSIIMGRALGPLEILIGGWKQLLTSIKSTRRLAVIVSDTARASNDAEAHARLPVPRGELRLEDVGYRFSDTDTPLIRNISLSVAPGEVVAVMGSGAAGKSTLARLMVGLEAPSEGKVTLDGVDLARWKREDVAPYIGYVSQDIELIDGSIAENISRMQLNVAPRGAQRDDVNREVLKAASAVGAHDTFAALPRAYDTRIGRGGVLLSTSQRRRITLARAIYGNIRLLVLDDPSSGLDAAGERNLVELIAALKKQNVAVVIFTSNAGLLQVTDRVAILDEKTIVRIARPGELFATNVDRQPAVPNTAAVAPVRSGPAPGNRPMPPQRNEYRVAAQSAVSPPHVGEMPPNAGPARPPHPADAARQATPTKADALRELRKRLARQGAGGQERNVAQAGQTAPDSV